jgi:hypothetical protein
MPEYLAPGVYVAEVAMEPKSIEGVSTSTAGLLGQNLIDELHRLLKRLSAGDPSEQNDLAIALLELLAWLTDTLSCHADKLADESYLPTKRLFAAALSLVMKNNKQPDPGVTRIRFFAGRLLDQADLDVEMDFATKRRSHIGSGILSGLEVNVNQRGIEVRPGYALDNRGRKIVLRRSIKQQLPPAGKRLSVIARPKGSASFSVAMLPTMECQVVLAGKPKRDDIAQNLGKDSARLEGGS